MATADKWEIIRHLQDGVRRVNYDKNPEGTITQNQIIIAEALVYLLEKIG